MADQSASKASSSNPAAEPNATPRRAQSNPETKRKGAASAIAVCSRKFHALLARTKEVFLEPLQEQARKDSSLLTLAQVKSIFSTLEAILTVTKALTDDINKLFSGEWSASFMLGTLLGKLDPYYRSYYLSYFSNFNYALYVLWTCRKENPRFATFVTNAEEQIRNKHGHKDAPLVRYSTTDEMFHPYDNIPFLQAVLAPRQELANPVTTPDYSYLYSDLPSLLLAPIHFLPKYKALVQSLLNATPPDSQDAETLLEHLSVVSATLHECATDLVNQHNTITQQQSIYSSSQVFLPRELVPARKLVRAGFLTQLVPQKVAPVIKARDSLDEHTTSFEVSPSDHSPSSSMLYASSPSNSQLSVKGWTFEGEGMWQGARINVRVLLFSDLLVVADAQQNEQKLYPLEHVLPASDIAVDSADAGADCSEYGMRIYSNVTELFLLDSDKSSREQWLSLFQKVSGKKHAVRRSFIVAEVAETNIDNIIKQLSEQRLKRLHIAPNSARPGQCLAIANTITTTAGLTSINLSYNHVDDGVMSVLANWLTDYNGLRSLRLDHNDITSVGATCLADALRFNTRLEELDLKYNRISDLGATGLCVSILAHPSITSLNLTHNEIRAATPFTRMALYNLLTYNKAISEIFIKDNFSHVDNGEIVGYLSGAVFSARVAALNFIDWNLDGVDDAVQKQMTEKLLMNVTRMMRASRSNTVTALPSANSSSNLTSPRSINGALQSSDALDMGYSGYVELSMREINNSLQGGSISNITTLYLDHNTLFQIGQPVLQKLTHLQSLFLSHNRFETLPPAIKFLTNLSVLDLSHNRFTRFPKEVIYLVNLQELDLSFNSIYSIGRDTVKHFVRLPKLWRLALHRNYLAQIPENLMTFTQITYLTVTANPAISLAKQKIYENFAEINPHLDLSRCGLKSLPIEIELLPHLTSLDLSNNYLETLPPHVQTLTTLNTLNLTQNQTSSLPWQLRNITSLTRLMLAGNPRLLSAMQAQAIAQAAGQNTPLGQSLHALQNFHAPYRPEYLEREVDAQKQFEKFKAPTQRFPCARMKLMLVGQENVGKTSLAHSLRRSGHVRPHTRFPTLQLMNKNKRRVATATVSLSEPINTPTSSLSSSGGVQYGSSGSLPTSGAAPLSTDGIDMEEWTPPTTEEPISFQVWDFAGQEVYYLTHQFFLRGGRCVYLVVFSLELGPDANRIEYWIKAINERAKDCSIILVGTHLDAVTEEKAASVVQELQTKYQKFTNIKSCIAVSCKNNRYMEKLKDLIISLGANDAKMKENFFQLESVVCAEKENRTPPLMSMTDFRSIARGCGILPNEIPGAVDLLVQLGTIIYYNDSNARLDDLIILDPRWLTKFMATLITTKPSFVQNGILPRQHLEQIWRAPEYPPDIHHSLMSLLHKFEICFPFPVQDKGYLVPSLLPANRPVLAHFVPDPQTRLERLYRFHSPLYGFFARLMVRLLHFMDGLQYWRDGILLLKDETHALLEFKTQSSQMQVRVWGAHACRYLRNIMENIDMLLRGWYYSKSSIIVPCVCQSCAPMDANTIPTQLLQSPKQRREARMLRRENSSNRILKPAATSSPRSSSPRSASPVNLPLPPSGSTPPSSTPPNLTTPPTTPPISRANPSSTPSTPSTGPSSPATPGTPGEAQPTSAPPSPVSSPSKPRPPRPPRTTMLFTTTPTAPPPLDLESATSSSPTTTAPITPMPRSTSPTTTNPLTASVPPSAIPRNMITVTKGHRSQSTEEKPHIPSLTSSPSLSSISAPNSMSAPNSPHTLTRDRSFTIGMQTIYGGQRGYIPYH